ncbi:MAG: Hsp70 family protein [Aeromicrobium sp.]|uniref:Hsp70 family protein n=1 Tax=Aeromicrobium sp. TaxID=1871063 RepID=UPI003C57B772
MTAAVDLGSSAVKVVDGVDAPVVRADGIGPEITARVGTTVPLMWRGSGCVLTQAPHEAYARAVATALVNTSAEFVTILVPDWWPMRARALAQQTLEDHASGPFQLVSPALSAVEAARATHDLPATVAVLDIGAESSCASIVTGIGDLPHILGRPAVQHGRAGNDIDRLLMQHVLSWVAAGDPTDPALAGAGRSLLAQVKAAKEQLSARPAASLITDLGGARTEVRLVRSDADAVVRETVDAIVTMLTACITSNGSDDVQAVLLTGGSVSIPLVTQIISVELGLPVVMDHDPATLAVRGAANIEMAVAPERRGWRRRRRTSNVACNVFDLRNAPAPASEPYLGPLRSASVERAAQAVLQLAESPDDVAGDSNKYVRAADDHSGRPSSRSKRNSRRKASVEPALANVRLVVETGPGPRPRQTATWTSVREGPGWKSARRAHVDDEGQFRLWVNDRDYEVNMGVEAASTTVTLILMGLHVFVTASETGQLLREMRLNPDHDFRPE